MNTYLFSVFALTVAIFTGCKNSSTSQPGNIPKLKVIRIAYQLGHLPDIVAKHRGMFEEEFKADGIKIEYKKFDFGPPLIEAFVTKNADIGTAGDQPSIIGWAKGADIKIVGNITGGGDKMALIVPNDSHVSSFQDLKGKKVALTVGANTQHLFYIFMENSGFQPTDVNVVNLPFSECVNAISHKQVDATILSDPFISLVLYRHIGKIVRYSGSLKYVTLPIVTSTEFIRKYPDVLHRLLKVYYQANDWAVKNKEETAQILRKEENNLLPQEIVLKLVDKYTHNYGLNDSAIVAYKATYDYLKKTNIIRKELDFTTLYDSTFDAKVRRDKY